jgi:hypothetical protein
MNTAIAQPIDYDKIHAFAFGARGQHVGDSAVAEQHDKRRADEFHNVRRHCLVSELLLLQKPQGGGFVAALMLSIVMPSAGM